MNKNEKIKRIVLIILAVAGSGYFMYSGFSLLFEEDETNATIEMQGVTPLSE